MRKILLLLFVSIIVFSCEKEPASEDFVLAGKKYVYSPQTVKHEGQYLHWVYYFTSSNSVEEQVRFGSPNGGLFGDIKKCKYTLNYPNLTITDIDGDFEYTFITKTTFRSSFNNTEYNLLQ